MADILAAKPDHIAISGDLVNLALNAEFDVSLNWLKSIGDYFEIDNFILADILNTTRRTKLEESHDFLFFNIKSLLPTEHSDNISVEQISFLFLQDLNAF